MFRAQRCRELTDVFSNCARCDPPVHYETRNNLIAIDANLANSLCQFWTITFLRNLRNRERHGHPRPRRPLPVRRAPRRSFESSADSIVRATSPRRWVSRKTATPRYERAEVEPSLTLIHKMCETLRVTPNELLEFWRDRDEGGFAAPAWRGLGEWSLRACSRWARPRRLAGLAPGVRSVAIAGAAQLGRASADPLDIFARRRAASRKLQTEPFGTVAEIVDDARMKTGQHASRPSRI